MCGLFNQEQLLIHQVIYGELYIVQGLGVNQATVSDGRVYRGTLTLLFRFPGATAFP